MTTTEPVLLWQTDRCWGMPSSSPFCVKLEAWLRMAGVPFEVRVLRGLPRSPTGKVPWVELPGGRLLCDSGVIIETLAAAHEVSLGEGLDAGQRALVTAFTRMLEDHFYWAIVWDRWIVPEHWAVTRAAYFGRLPPPLRWVAPVVARRQVKGSIHGQGFGRMSEQEIMARVEQDLSALAQQLGDGEHVLGQPSLLDAVAFGFVGCALRPPFDGPLQQAVRRHPTLMEFCERFQARWWPAAPAEDLD